MHISSLRSMASGIKNVSKLHSISGVSLTSSHEEAFRSDGASSVLQVLFKVSGV